MKTEFQDISETQKTISIEIPSDVVDAEIDRVARGYSKQARLPGFRPGKVPSNIIKQRFREEIHHEVMHGLIPRAIEEALQERGIEPVSTPDIKDVSLREGEPLKFTADVDKTLERLRERGAKFETVEGRPVSEDDTASVDLDRTDPDGKVDHHEGVS